MALTIASSQDLPKLVEMMGEFYAESGYVLDRCHATEAFAVLLGDERLGFVGIFEVEGQQAGYGIVTLCHSIEFGGPIAFVDDLFVRRDFRRAGLGAAALAEVRDLCASRGVRAIYVETGEENAAAQAVYRKVGFEVTDRRVLVLKLEKPTHVE